MKNLLYILALNTLFLVSCNEEDDLTGTYLYVETQCADAWTPDGDSVEDYASAVQSYLVTQHSIYSALEEVKLADVYSYQADPPIPTS